MSECRTSIGQHGHHWEFYVAELIGVVPNRNLTLLKIHILLRLICLRAALFFQSEPEIVSLLLLTAETSKPLTLKLHLHLSSIRAGQLSLLD